MMVVDRGTLLAMHVTFGAMLRCVVGAVVETRVKIFHVHFGFHGNCC